MSEGSNTGTVSSLSRARYPDLEGQVAVVTGAAKGIGRGIALRLASEGMRIVAADIDEAGLGYTVDALRDLGATAEAVTGDLSQAADIDAVFRQVAAHFANVDLLVNNAADLQRGRLLDDDPSLLVHQLATNVRGPYLCARQAAAQMKDAGGGSIVNISSVGAARAHHRGLPYDVTKGAINAMTRAMAVDLGMYGIRVNAIGPGLTHTYRTDPTAGSYQAAAAQVPLRRFGTPDDIAAVVAFLASEDASYVTGQVIYVDGGLVAQLNPAEPDTGPPAQAHATPATGQPAGNDADG